MLKSEIPKVFDETRDDFKPYGLTCELWSPGTMRRPDRHNEVEINYFVEDAITYLFQDRRVTIPARRLAIFWGLIPHQIVSIEGRAPYFVCTIPLSLFLEWKLPASFVDRVLKGDVLLELSEDHSLYDEYLLKNWISDMNSKDSVAITLLEMHARLMRMATINQSKKENEYSPIHSSEVSTVEKIAIYIAQNYCKPIRVGDVGKAVGLHSDYANSIFKKAFGCTLNEYIIEQRISHAQRKLVATDESVTQIAFGSGFNSTSRFNAAFLKANQCTPRQFRKKSLGH